MGDFTKNTSIIVLVTISRFAAAFVSSILLARVLGPERMGQYAILLLVAMLAVKTANLGIEPATVYHIGKKDHSLKTIFGNNLILGSLIGCAAAAAAVLFVFFFHGDTVGSIPLFYMFLIIALVPISFLTNVLQSILLGLQKFFSFSLFKLSADLLLLVLMAIALVMLKGGLFGALLAHILSALIIVTALIGFLLRWIRGIDWKLSKAYCKDLFFYGLQSYAAGLLGFLHYRVDILFVNILLGSLAVGYYALAASVAEGLWIVSSAAAVVLFSRITSERDEKNLKEFTPLVARNVFFLTVIGSAALLLLGRWIIPLLYSESFLPALRPLYILLPGVALMSITGILANDYAGRGKPIINVYLAAYAVTANILLNLFLIPRFGIDGAALASTISYSTFSVLSMYIYKNISGNPVRLLFVPQSSDWSFYISVFRFFSRRTAFYLKLAFKRLFDFVCAFAGIILLLPFFAVAALLIKRYSPGPVFYRGVRVGKNGKFFRMFKFRTMVENADKIGGPSTAGDDPRLTGIGKFLRAYKLDELPQLINVFKGEMSLVGPRPEVPFYVNMMTEGEKRIILSVKPGITDLASLWNIDEAAVLHGSPDPEKTYQEKIWPEKKRLQMKYVAEQSFLGDLKIIFRTLKDIV